MNIALKWKKLIYLSSFLPELEYECSVNIIFDRILRLKVVSYSFFGSACNYNIILRIFNLVKKNSLLNLFFKTKQFWNNYTKEPWFYSSHNDVPWLSFFFHVKIS